MLTSTFIHAPGIGAATEKRLWDRGATTWDRFLEAPDHWELSPSRQSSLTEALLESREALAAANHRYFAERLKPKDHWRAAEAFRGSLAYLDIETTGMGLGDQITVIGLYDGTTFHHFVSGENLLDFLEVIDTYKVLVTFFGTGFDLPMLRRQFTGLSFPQLHVDLCFLCRRLGLKGGLKSIEEQLGIGRSDTTTGLSGWDAVRLWWEYRHGSQPSLETLLRYNEEDVRHLETLLAHALQGITAHYFPDGPPEATL
ncbi:MAG TPA: ribonuclease H-like domain-containing protein [Armatimonadota bacterium]